MGQKAYVSFYSMRGRVLKQAQIKNISWSYYMWQILKIPPMLISSKDLHAVWILFGNDKKVRWQMQTHTHLCWSLVSTISQVPLKANTVFHKDIAMPLNNSLASRSPPPKKNPQLQTDHWHNLFTKVAVHKAIRWSFRYNNSLWKLVLYRNIGHQER